MDLLKVRDAIVEVFLTPAALDAWVGADVANVNVNNIFAPGSMFNKRAYDLLERADAQGRIAETLQALADPPPRGAVPRACVLFAATKASSPPLTAPQTRIPPV